MPLKSLTMLVGSQYILSDQDGVREWNATCTCMYTSMTSSLKVELK